MKLHDTECTIHKRKTRGKLLDVKWGFSLGWSYMCYFHVAFHSALTNFTVCAFETSLTRAAIWIDVVHTLPTILTRIRLAVIWILTKDFKQKFWFVETTSLERLSFFSFADVYAVFLWSVWMHETSTQRTYWFHSWSLRSPVHTCKCTNSRCQNTGLHFDKDSADSHLYLCKGLSSLGFPPFSKTIQRTKFHDCALCTQTYWFRSWFLQSQAGKYKHRNLWHPDRLPRSDKGFLDSRRCLHNTTSSF